MSKLGSEVVSLRERRNMSQRELARASGLTPSYVSKIESGDLRSVPSMNAITSLADALDAEPGQLMAAAGRLPSPFDVVASQPEATRFFRRAIERIRDPQDWERLTAALESPDFGLAPGSGRDA